MNKHAILVIMGLLLHLNVCWAQQDQVYGLGKLSSNLITEITQDSSGFIWIGTENGLNKFDGWKFTHYYNNNQDSTSLVGNYVETFLIDSNNDLWIASNKGLQCYSPENDFFKRIKFPNGIYPSVKDILQLNTGEIWIVTAGYGLFLVDKEKMVATSLSDLNNKLKIQYAVRLYQDRSGLIWIGLSDNRLACVSLDRKKVQTYDIPIDRRNRIYGIVEDEYGRMFIATTGDVFLWDNIRHIFIPIQTEKNESINLRGIYKLNSGQLCVYTASHGVMFLEPDAMKLYSPTLLPNGHYNPKGEKINAFFEDKKGSLWFGFYKKWLSLKLTEPKQFEFWNLTGYRSESALYTSFCDKQNNVWVGLDNGKLLKLGELNVIKQVWQLPVSISKIFEDKDGVFWIGSFSQGLGVFDRKTGEYKSLNLFGNEFISSIAEDNKDNLYISVSSKGFARYNKRTKKYVLFSDTVYVTDSSHLSNNWVGDILCDSNGLIWLALSVGVDCYDPENNKFLNFPGQQTLRSYDIVSLLEDGENNIWLATTNGLFKFNKNTNLLKYYGVDDGLPNNIICGLGTDLAGNIWGSTQNGLFQLNSNNERIASYFSGNGLVEREYSKRVATQNKDGYIYFGGMKGITRFMPDSIKYQQIDYHPVLTHLYLNNISISANTMINNKPVSDTNLINTSKINLSYKEKNFSLEFSTMNFHNPENIIFEYRLIGVNEDWNKTFSGGNRITYNSLSPGKYKLEVRAFENNTYSLTKDLDIIISPPWYVTTWAIALYIIILLIIMFGLWYLWHKRQIRRQEERNNEEKLKFFINIAHEIRSPLTLILSPLADLLKQEHNNENAKILRTIQRNSNRIMNLINQLLDMRKIDKGQMKIICQESDLVGFIKDLLLTFDYQAERRNMSLIFEHEIDYLPIWIDRNNFDKVLMNLLVNAFKFTPDGGEIKVYLKVSNSPDRSDALSYAEIHIVDSGPGLNEKEIGKIFDRFYQTPTQNSLGFGIGLNLAKMLIELHHGTIYASNRKDVQGSCFIIKIPMGKSHLTIEEISEKPPVHRSFLESSPYWNEREEISGSKNKHRKKILVVDDDEEIREYLSKELSPFYKVLTGNNGTEALQLLLKQRIDLIISDVMMPDVDGFTLLKKIRNNNNISHIPVILLTSQVEFNTRMKGWDVGADGFMDKPFQIEELLHLCDNLIKNRTLLKGKFAGFKELEDRVNPVEVKSNDEQFMNRLMNLINQNLNNPQYTVEILAKEVGISRAQLHRKLKEITGLTTSDFIRNVRLKQAAKLLVENKINISQIAYATGFTTPTVFAVAFKKLYGCTPTEYIENGGIDDIEES